MSSSDAERKRANREKMRRYRERKAEEAARAAAVTGNAGNGNDVTPPPPAPRVMRDEVEKALEAMKWLVESDGAAVAQARMLAELVDLATHDGETTRALSAHRALTKVLNDLGGTPNVRMHQELRSRRGGDQPEVPEDEHDEEPTGSNVTRFERPAGRRQG